jgi:hypothetical protein
MLVVSGEMVRGGAEVRQNYLAKMLFARPRASKAGFSDESKLHSQSKTHRKFLHQHQVTAGFVLRGYTGKDSAVRGNGKSPTSPLPPMGTMGAI